MNARQFWGGFIGFCLALVPVLGSLCLIVLFCVRKTFNFTPVFCLIFIALATNSDYKTERKRTSLQAELSQTMENKLFSIAFQPHEKLTFGQLLDTIQNLVADNVESEYLPNPWDSYRDMADIYYNVYETEYAENRASDHPFYIPVAKREEIQAQIASFSSYYAQRRHPDSLAGILYIALAGLLWLCAIPYYTYWFAQNLFQPKAAKTPPANLLAINSLSEEDIRKQLKMNALDAKTIVTVRKQNGHYLDFPDFVKRTNLSERVCNQFKDRLDFSSNDQPDNQPDKPPERRYGRVFEI